MDTPQSFGPVGRGWGTRLYELVQAAENELFICSPFVSKAGADAVLSNLSESFLASGRLTLLTDLSPIAACEGATDPTAIADLAAGMRHSSVVHLSKLHAKVYIADSKRAIVTSGNLTAGGLFRNFEYGIESQDLDIVAAMTRDLKEYAALGAVLDRSYLEKYREVADRARVAYVRQQTDADRSTIKELRELIAAAQDELIRNQLSRGPMPNIFAGTILYVLERNGSLSTEEIHPLVEQIHPDLCDNSVDRIIDGRRFGKKWKHAVRTAQQRLKERGRIELLEDGRWAIVGSTSR